MTADQPFAEVPDTWEARHVMALRYGRCETQAEFADVAGVVANTVWLWEAGRRQPRRPWVVRSLNALLEGLTPAQRRRYDTELARLSKTENPDGDGVQQCEDAPLAADAPTANKGSVDVHRRDLLEVFIATLAAGGTGCHWQRQEAPKVDAGLVAAHEQVMDVLAGTFISADPKAMLPTVSRFADGLTPLLGLAPTHDLGLGLAAVAVDAHAMAGRLALHAQDPVLRRRHLAEGSRIAEASGDAVLRARAWSMLACYLHSPLHDGYGSARQAVALLGRARALGRHADGHMRAWLAASFGQEAAELGDVGLCEWAVEEGVRALDAATGHSGGFFCPQAGLGPVVLYLSRVAGRAAGLAGRVDEAERAISQELSGAVCLRHRVNGLCALGTVRVDNAQPEGACVALGEAAGHAHTGCPDKEPRIRAVRRKMPPAWDGLACVADLDERLALT